MGTNLLEKFGGTITIKAHADADAAEAERLYQQALRMDVELSALWKTLQSIFDENRKLLEEINKAKRDVVKEIYNEENLAVLAELRGNPRAEKEARAELEGALKELEDNLTATKVIEREAVLLRMFAGDHKYRQMKIDRDRLFQQSWNIKVRANQGYVSAGYPPIMKEVRPAFRNGPATPQALKRKFNSKKESANVKTQ